MTISSGASELGFVGAPLPSASSSKCAISPRRFAYRAKPIPRIRARPAWTVPGSSGMTTVPFSATSRQRSPNVVQGENSVALEWTSQGSLRTGRPISYRGVSVLEGDETEIRSFRTYYGSAAFLSDTTH